MTPDSSTSFEKTTELRAESPTLIERLPGLGLVAVIAVDQITKQPELDQHGTIVSDDFPSVAAFDDGRIRDAVRVYAGEDPPVRTLQSDIPIPPAALLSESVCPARLSRGIRIGYLLDGGSGGVRRRDRGNRRRCHVG